MKFNLLLMTAIMGCVLQCMGQSVKGVQNKSCKYTRKQERTTTNLCQRVEPAKLPLLSKALNQGTPWTSVALKSIGQDLGKATKGRPVFKLALNPPIKTDGRQTGRTSGFGENGQKNTGQQIGGITNISKIDPEYQNYAARVVKSEMNPMDAKVDRIDNEERRKADTSDKIIKQYSKNQNIKDEDVKKIETNLDDFIAKTVKECKRPIDIKQLYKKLNGNIETSGNDGNDGFINEDKTAKKKRTRKKECKLDRTVNKRY